MYEERLKFYEKIEQEFNSKLLIYVTSDRRNMETQIASDAIDLFIEHLDKIGVQDKISLYLYTRGGDTAAAWNIVNLLKMYCEELQVIIPHKAHSAGTLISIGANSIVMTKQATLGPIDPSVNTAMNPITPNGLGTFPVSVEAVKGYLAFANEELKIEDDEALAKILVKLTEYVHPLVLGQVYRSRAQIQMLAEKLLKSQIDEPEKVKKIIGFLCSDSGSHDYTINRREAENDLELKIIKPTEDQYEIIKLIYDDINTELEFNNVFNISEINGEYAIRRGLVESIAGGSDYFVTEGQCIQGMDQNGQNVLQNKITFEGWRHDDNVKTEMPKSQMQDKEEVTKYEKSIKFCI